MDNQGFQIEPPVVRPPVRKGKSGCFWASLGIGCLGTLFLCCGGFFVMGAFGVNQMFRASEPFQHAVKAAKDNPEIQQAVGDDMDGAWPMSGSINNQNGNENVDINFALKGNKGRGKIHVRAHKTDGPWQYDEITFTDENGKSIDLNTTSTSTDQ